MSFMMVPYFRGSHDVMYDVILSLDLPKLAMCATTWKFTGSLVGGGSYQASGVRGILYWCLPGLMLP